MKQVEAVLQHLKREGSLTSKEAFELYGITRLSARILELRKLGVAIESVNETVGTRYEKPATIARYRLAAKGQLGLGI